MTEKLSKAKDKLATFRAGRGPKPDPQSPHNPYHLPDADMNPRRGVPTRDEYVRRGGDGMQATHTATLPNPLIWNWPPRLTDSLYEYCWKNYHGGASAAQLVGRLETAELDILLEALDGFRLEDLAPVGVSVYEALVDEAARRHQPEQPRKRIAVDIREVLHEHDHEEEQSEVTKTMPLRRFP